MTQHGRKAKAQSNAASGQRIDQHVKQATVACLKWPDI